MNYLKISIKQVVALTPPHFLGSLLRGSFGYALKNVTCLSPKGVCEGCFASSNCVYYDFYEQKNNYHSFRFDFELYPQNFDFNLYLFGDSMRKIPYILSALQKMATQNGYGKDRIKATNLQIAINGKSVYDGFDFDLSGIEQNEVKFDKFCPNVVLRFATPLRMKKNGKQVWHNELELKDILQSIHNKLSQLEGKALSRLEFTPTGEIVESKMRFIDFTRLSNRQKMTMQLGGLVGEIRFAKMDKESYEMLKMGEIMGVGKQSVFGLGKIEVMEER